MFERGESGVSGGEVTERSSYSFSDRISDSRDMAVVEIDESVGREIPKIP
jgi:hypothetical protein